jgi:hypothetical protein
MTMGLKAKTKGGGALSSSGLQMGTLWVALWRRMEGWDDVDINSSDTSTPTHNQISSLITRAHAHQLNNQVSSFLASYSSYLDNGNMYSVLLLRNDEQERNGAAFASTTFEFQNSSNL